MDLDMARSRRDIDALRAHAAANAWIPAQRSDPAASAAIEAVGAVLPAWQILRQTSVATDDDRAVVEGWLIRVARFTDIHPGGNSIGTQRGTNEMLLGLIVGDDALYQKGLQEGFYAQLRGMRPDGSFPLETDRGRKALEHTGRNISLLVYCRADRPVAGDRSLRDRGGRKSLDDAIGLSAPGRRDNALVDVYARANRNPGLGFGDFRAELAGHAVRRLLARLDQALHQRFPNGDCRRRCSARSSSAAACSTDTTGGSVSCYATRL